MADSGSIASRNEFLEFIDAAAGSGHVRVEEHLGSGFVRLRTDEAERRQAKHDIRRVEDVVIELLRNARDAGATSIFLASTRDGAHRLLTIIDNGDGMPESMHDRVFEPRVTTKLDTMSMDRWGVHGRGMALFSIRENADEARVMVSAPGEGASIRVRIDTELIPERADQSTIPRIERDSDGKPEVTKGPRNINRTVAEFAADAGGVKVYLGSPSEIAATLLRFGEDETGTLPITPRTGVCAMLTECSTAAEVVHACHRLGLPVSERNAHRIISGSVKPLKPYLTSIMVGLPQPPTAADIFRDSRALRISEDDMELFSRKLETAFEELSSRYFINLLEEPRISVGKDAIRVTFPIEKE
ncbi:MAG: ATP-binding protein [Coriobacteriales bacterium]|jgi:hypothetical protein